MTTTYKMEPTEKITDPYKELAMSVFFRALADICHADSLCEPEDADTALDWLHTADAYLYSDGHSESAITAIENNPDAFKRAFKKNYKIFNRAIGCAVV